MSNMALINFISINARGLNTKEKRLKFYNWLHDSKIDIALDIDIINRHSSNDGRKILIGVKIGKTDLTLVNIYVPNNESHRIQFF